MMLAWLSSSERMKSSLPRIEETVPALAAKPRLEDDAGFDVFEGGDLFFELHVDAHGAGDGADGSGADAVFSCGGDSGLVSLGWLQRPR